MSLEFRTPNGKCPVMVRLKEDDFQELRRLSFDANLTPNKYMERLLVEKLRELRGK